MEDLHFLSDKSSGNPFIDQNHQNLLLLVSDLAEKVRRGTLDIDTKWDDIQSESRDYVQSLENHFQHEELILKGAKYDNIDEHIAKHREISFFLRTITTHDFTKDTAQYFISCARTKIFSHELMDDQDYWPVFEADSGFVSPLITWTRKMEVGEKDVDAHHHALINYINRLYQRVRSDQEESVLWEELESLLAYSHFHFEEEEKLFGPHLSDKDRVLHNTEHQRLLDDLGTVISEIKSGNYSINGLDGYLKYWFLNHIQKYDKPAFKNFIRKQ